MNVIDPAPTNAVATCSGITVNDYYVAGKNLTSSNSLTVTANVSAIGTYEFSSENIAANIKFTASGRFTRTGFQTFTALASKINTENPVGPIIGYSLTSSFNSESFCNYNLDIIYPSTKVLLYTQNTAYIKQALTPGSLGTLDTNNFSPNGKFKTENINVIYDATNWTLSAATLLNYINNQNVQIIVIPQQVIIPVDVQQVLANFIKKRNGKVIFSSAADVTQATQIKGVIDKLYPGSATINPNNFGSQYFTATIFPTDDNNPYLKGAFGEVQRRYYLLYHYNTTPDIVLTGASNPLKSLVQLPAGANVTARDAFVYSETPGLFIIPGDLACLGHPNTLYGNYWPIQPNTNPQDTYAYSGEPTTTNQYPYIRLNSGMIINWVLFGNIMSEYIKHSYYNYKTDVIIDSRP